MNKIKIGDLVEMDVDGTGRKIQTGTVLEVSARKARIAWSDGTEPTSEYLKYLTVASKATRSKAAAKADGIKVPKVRVPRKLGLVPVTRADGEPSRSIVAGADLSHYAIHTDVPTKSGRPSLDIGDHVASLLRGKDSDEVIKITANELTRITGETVTQSGLRTKYEKLNAGQIRMNCGNRLRAAFRAEADAD